MVALSWDLNAISAAQLRAGRAGSRWSGLAPSALSDQSHPAMCRSETGEGRRARSESVGRASTSLGGGGGLRQLDRLERARVSVKTQVSSSRPPPSASSSRRPGSLTATSTRPGGGELAQYGAAAARRLAGSSQSRKHPAVAARQRSKKRKEKISAGRAGGLPLWPLGVPAATPRGEADTGLGPPGRLHQTGAVMCSSR